MSVFIDKETMTKKKSHLFVAIWRWLRELAAMVPASLLVKRRNKIILLKTEGRLEAHCVRPNGIQRLWTVEDTAPLQEPLRLKASLAKHCNRRTDVILRLSSRHALQQKITLPRAALDVLEPVIENQLDQIMPWPQHETIFGHGVDNRHDKAAQITVTVAATSRKILNNALEQLGEIDAKPDFVDCGDNPGSENCIKLCGDDDGARTRLARGIGICLGILLITSLVIGSIGLVPMVRQQLMLSQFQTLSDQKRKVLSTIDARNEFSRKLRRQANKIINRKTSRPAIMIVLEMISRALPDSVWLTNLEVRGEKVQLRGKAANASGLIATLEELPFFKDVQFSAHTTRRENDAQETFAISARILPVSSMDQFSKSLGACCRQPELKTRTAAHR